MASMRPHYIYKRKGSPMGFAGLWETWKGEDETIESCAIITASTKHMMAELHTACRDPGSGAF
jgi:putative SOS response-associated peptidase YedK